MTKFRWTLMGSEGGYRGTLNPGVEESGVREAEGAGEVADWLVQRGPWDLVDQDECVTITIEPQEEPYPEPGGQESGGHTDA